MRIASIPATFALLSASIYLVITLYLPAPCEAFVPFTAKPRTNIYNTKYSHCFLKSTDHDGGSLVDSVDEIESRVSAMKVTELKAELKSHGQTTTGLKKVLQERLLDFYEAKMTNLEEESSSDNVDNEDEDEDDNDYGNSADIEKEAEEDDIDDAEDYNGFERELVSEMEEEEEHDIDDDMYSVDSQDEKPLPDGLLHSKRKWKKKTYLLMSDARKLTYSKDAVVRQRAPRKAKEVVRRIQRWISLSSSTSSFSTNFEDDSDVSDYESFEGDDPDVIEILDLDGIAEFEGFQRSTLLRAYNIWIHAIAKSGDDDAGYQAEQILNEMQKNISSGGPSPDEITIASVMDAHAHSATVSSSKSGAQAAEAFLFELLEKSEAADDGDDVPWSHDGNNKLRDSLIVTCDTMLNAWAREGTMESAERAQLILLRLEEYQRQREKQRKMGRSRNARRNSLPEEETTMASAGKKRPISYATGTFTFTCRRLNVC